MASSVPEQYRVVDPYASYNSNTVNQLTEMVSRAENALDIPCSLEVVIDSTSPTNTVVVKPGYVYKDDVLIFVSEDHQVDFTDSDQYITVPNPGDLTVGYYYIVLQYTYIKSRPAPQARVKIIRPDQRNNYDYGSSTTSLIFLKAVYVSSISPIIIDSVYDSDPSIGYTDNKRKFVKRYVGSETDFDPTDFEKCRDQSRIAYDVTTDQFYIGYADRWELLGSATFNIDSTAANVGQLCYVDSNGEAALAIATAEATGAEMVVVEVGVAADGSGQAKLLGYVEGVLAETGITISTGDLLYLSNTEAGLVTNVKTSPLYQVIGRAVSDGDDTTPFNILFFGRAVLETGTASRLVATANSWTLSGSDYYHDIDITDLGLSDQDVIVSCRDTSTNMVATPGDIDLSIANTVRIWMPVNTVTLQVTVVG
jgi:hypothetical protein